MDCAFVCKTNEGSFMSIYTRTADASRKYSSYKWKAPLTFAVFVSIAILCSRYELFWGQRYPQLPDIPFRLYPIAVIGAIFSFGFMFAVHYGLQRMRTLQISVTAEGVCRCGGEYTEDLFLPRAEIRGYTERKGGMLLRTTDPKRWIFVPSGLERYAEARSELTFMAINRISGSGEYHLQTTALVFVSLSLLLVLCGQSLGARVLTRKSLCRLYDDRNWLCRLSK
jgi:hypothetical protein